MGQELSSIWFATPQKFRSILKWSERDDRGVLAIHPRRILFVGDRTRLDIRTLKDIALVRPPIPWLNLAIGNLLICAGLLVHATSVYTLDNPLTNPLVFAINLLFLFLWCSRWVRVEYTDEDGQSQWAFFTDGSSQSWARILGGPERLFQKMRAALAAGTTGSSEEGDSTSSRAAADQERFPGRLESICEECGKSSLFLVSHKGTVQDCPHCGSYMDVK
jgi:hypothetical protein